MTPHRWLKRRLSILILLLVCVVCVPAFAFAGVDVYAEGVYSDTELVLKIYADINVNAILSFGVRVNYPSGLTYASAEKNEEVWYFGDGAADFEYMDPQDDGSGVVIIGGKLNTAAPTEGVIGSRVLLGTVTFTRTGIVFGHPINDPAPITLDFAHSGDYANFVETNGNVLDAPSIFSDVTISKMGDANLDDRVNTQDMSIVRSTMTSGGVPHLWIDCTLDGRINTQDMSCVRNIMTN